MNEYFIRFLNLDFTRHLSMWKNDFNGNVLMVLIIRFVVLLLFFALPYVVIRMVNEKENKAKNKKLNIIIDIVSFIVFLFIGQMLFNFSATMISSISSIGLTDERFRNLYYHRRFIADVCGVLYSLLLNTRLFGKYINNLVIKKVIFVLLFIISLFIFYYFYYLCHLL